MKKLVFILALACSNLFAQYNPTMRINFGGSSAMVRLSSAYLFNPSIQNNNKDLTQASNSGVNSMHLGFESLFIINNRGRFSESVSRTASRFLIVRVNHNGPAASTLSSASLGTALKCRTSIPFFGQVKGYWSIGLAARFNGQKNPDIIENQNRFGARMAFNIYNKRSALQAEVCGFSDKAIVNVLVYKKISSHLLLSTGYEYQQAYAGFNVLFGSCRLTVGSHLATHHQLHHSVGLVANL